MDLDKNAPTSNDALLVRLTHIEKQNSEMQSSIRLLLDAEAERRGRESVKEHEIDKQREDRWQVWFRAFVPAGIITIIINALLLYWTSGAPK